MSKTVFANKVWQYMFALQIVMAIMPALVKANAEIPEASDNEDFMIPDQPNLYEAKRNWQSLHGAWGKRVMMDDMDAMDNDKMAYLPRGPIVCLVNPGALISTNSYDNMYDDNIYNEKRGWKKMNVAWGKRRNNGNEYAPSSSAGGAWGKRQADWYKLKGMWGKRSIPSQLN